MSAGRPYWLEYNGGVPTVLIADPNTSFATFIGEELRQLGDYRTRMASNGPEAMRRGMESRFDLAVIDADLPDCHVPDLIAQLRQHTPDIKIVLIPFTTQEVPTDLDIHGVLTKPFFLLDLAELVQALLGPPAPAEAAPEPTPEPPAAAALMTAMSPEARRLVEAHVTALSHAVRNEPVLLTQGQTVIAMAPRLSKTGAAALASLIGKAADSTSPETLRFAGETDNTRFTLYTLRVLNDVQLSIALRVRIPLTRVRRLAADTRSELVQVMTHAKV